MTTTAAGRTIDAAPSGLQPLPAGFATVPSTWRERKTQLFRFSVAAVSITGSFVFAAFGGAPDRPIICPLRAMTGIPCPLCNMTHSFSAFAGGKVADAFYYSPFGPPLFLAFVVGAIVIASLLIRRRRLVIPRAIMLAAPWVIGALTLVLWAYEIAVFAKV